MNRIVKKLPDVGLYLFGLYLIAVGVYISILSDLGVSPFNAIAYPVSEVSPLSFALCVTLVHVSCLAIQALLYGRNFKPISLFQLISSFLFGYVMDFTISTLLWVPACTNYGMQLIYAILGIIGVGVGVYVYLRANVLPLPSEGILEAMNYRFGWSIGTAKIVFDVGMCLGGLAVGLIFSGSVIGLREGTLLAAVGTGLIIQWCATFDARFIKSRKN